MTSASQPASSGFSASPFSARLASAPSPTASVSSTTSSGDRLDAAAAPLRERLLAFEHLLDAALQEGGVLCAELVRARHAAGLSAVVGQPVFASITQALGSITDARGQAVQAHKLLDRIGQALGYNDPGYGDAGKDPFTTAIADQRIEA